MRKSLMKKLSGILVACSISLAALGFGLTKAFADTTPEVLFQDSYEMNTVLELPKHNLNIGGKVYDGEKIVIFPDGTAKRADEVKLSQAGKYTIEYRALVNGKTQKDSYSFVVNQPLVSFTASSDTYEYGTFEEYAGLTGLYMKIANGSSATFSEVIDFRNMEYGESFISFLVAPETIGEVDARIVHLILSDVVDPTQSIEIRIRQSPDYVNFDPVSYITAKAYNQPTHWGSDRGDGANLLSPNYGFTTNFSFTGKYMDNPAFMLKIGYHNETQTVTCENSYWGGGNYVIDFNNGAVFSDGWAGFPSGMAKLTILPTDFDKSNIGLLITELGSMDLTQKYLQVDETSEINVDFGAYTQDSIPSAVVGKPYKIFPASSASLYSPEKIVTRVYTGYGSSAAAMVSVKNGIFTPLSEQTHTIEYTCIDGFGNKRITTVPVNVKSKSNPLSFDLESNDDIELMIGEYLNVPAITEIRGGDGFANTSIIMKNQVSGKETILAEDRIRIIESGNCSLIYSVSDYNGQTVTKSLDVTVLKTGKPVLSEDPVLPIYYIQGAKYAIPALNAEDFSSGTLQYLNAVATVQDGAGNNVTATNGYFTVPATDKLLFIYTATDALGRSDQVNYEVPVIDVGFAGKLDVSKYFIAENANLTLEKDALVFNPTAENSSYLFIRELDGKNFSTVFNFKKDAGNCGEIKFIFQSASDLSKKVELSFINQNGAVSMSVLNGLPVNVGFAFDRNLSDVNINLNGTTISANGTSREITTYTDGTAFTGFDGNMYLTIEILQATGDTSFELKKIKNQGFNTSVSFDFTEPGISVNGTYGGFVSINSITKIPLVRSLDVLDPYSEVTLRVVAPSGAAVTSIDGQELKNISADREFEFKVEEYGRYSIQFVFTDSAGNSNTFGYALNCLDVQAPQLVVEKNTISGSVDKEISLPGFEVSDNLSKADDMVVYVQIIDPRGVIMMNDNTSSFMPKMKGTYIVRYFVFDKEYNITYQDVICEVK